MPSTDSKVDIFIVGAGPVGAATAIYLMEETALNIAIADCRDDPLRPQVLRGFSMDSVGLYQRAGVAEVHQHANIQIKDAERAIRAKLQQLASENPARLQVLVPFEVIDITPQSGVATLRKVDDPGCIKGIRFRHIISADGARRRSLQLMGIDTQASHRACVAQPVMSHMAVVRLQCKGHTLVPSRLGGQSSAGGMLVQLTQLTHIADPQQSSVAIRAWASARLPYAYTSVIGNKNHDKVVLHTEIPPCVAEEQDIEKKERLLLAWSRRVLSLMAAENHDWISGLSGDDRAELAAEPEVKIIEGDTAPMEAEFTPLAPSKKHDPKAKDHLNHLVTSMYRDVMRDPIRPLPTVGDEGSGVHLCVGDALATSYFPAANGAELGMELASKLPACFDYKGDFDRNRFDREIKRVLHKAEQTISRSIRLRHQSMAHSLHAHYHRLKRDRSRLIQLKADQLHTMMHWSDSPGSSVSELSELFTAVLLSSADDGFVVPADLLLNLEGDLAASHSIAVFNAVLPVLDGFIQDDIAYLVAADRALNGIPLRLIDSDGVAERRQRQQEISAFKTAQVALMVDLLGSEQAVTARDICLMVDLYKQDLSLFRRDNGRLEQQLLSWVREHGETIPALQEFITSLPLRGDDQQSTRASGAHLSVGLYGRPAPAPASSQRRPGQRPAGTAAASCCLVM